ncbi:MAG: hypothetical protein MUC65_10725 [Pontiellaceae bacterium]|jgi:hypothetical protein|nr:hypothetical protein [Pontiellaceae bacterium]
MMMKMVHSVIGAVLFSGSLFGGVSSIEELDNAALFSFAVFSDSRGETDENAGKALEWIKTHDDFCIANGDIFDGNAAVDEAFLAMWRDDSYWHNNLYPAFGNHCSRINGGFQPQWGRPAFTLTNLNLIGRPGVEFRIPTSEPIRSFPTKDAQLAGQPYTNYPDQYIDYYVRRTFGDFTVHLVIVYKQDRAVFAQRSADFLYSKVMELASFKTDHDIVILAAHDERWFGRSAREGFAGYPVPLTDDKLKDMLADSDLIVSSSDHRFRRLHEEDSYGVLNQALVVDSGQVYNAEDTDGYLEAHVFDNPPRFTVQYIGCNNTPRKLHINVPVSYKLLPERGETIQLVTPMLKYVNGPIVQPLDWDTFLIGPHEN